MKIVYLGSGRFGIDCLDALVQSGNTPAFIVTASPRPAGRGQKPRPTPVALWAENHKIEFAETDNVNTPEMTGKIASCKPDLILVIAFGQKIGNQLITLPPKGIINVHASLLPKYRGAAPINRAIIEGEKQTGVSIITVAERMDAGDILAQAETDIGPDETAGQLYDRLARLAAPLLLETIEKIDNGTAEYIEQDNSKATLASKMKKSDGLLDFNEPAMLLERKIRGLWPWPQTAAVYLSKKTGKTKQVALVRAKVVESESNLPTGTLDEKLNVICGQGALEILQIKPAGGRLEDFKDFVNGQRCCPGDRFIGLSGQA